MEQDVNEKSQTGAAISSISFYLTLRLNHVVSTPLRHILHSPDFHAFFFPRFISLSFFLLLLYFVITPVQAPFQLAAAVLNK